MAPRVVRLSSLLSLALASSLTLAGCDAPAPADAPTKAAEPVAEAPAEEPGQTGAPKITADAATFEFGTIRPGQSVEHVFTVRNTGDADLHIERVQKT